MAFRSPSFEAVQEAHIGNVVLGRAPVKIISSVCAATAEEMIEQAKAIEASGADIIEWRADYFAECRPMQGQGLCSFEVEHAGWLLSLRHRQAGGRLAGFP